MNVKSPHRFIEVPPFLRLDSEREKRACARLCTCWSLTNKQSSRITMVRIDFRDENINQIHYSCSALSLWEKVTCQIPTDGCRMINDSLLETLTVTLCEKGSRSTILLLLAHA